MKCECCNQNVREKEIRKGFYFCYDCDCSFLIKQTDNKAEDTENKLIMIDKNDLMDFITDYKQNQYEANPASDSVFCDYIFKMYHRERLRRVDTER